MRRHAGSYRFIDYLTKQSDMILGGIIGLVFGCFLGMFNVLIWRSLGPPTDLHVRLNVYMSANMGFHNGW